MDDLRSGVLAPFLERVLADRSLCLEIREDYVNIYYRGGNLLKLSAGPAGYVAHFDPKYAKGDGGTLARALPGTRISAADDVDAWLGAMPAMKQTMDIYFGRHPKEEREAQQLIVRDNNFGGVSRATDYYVCDIEYANPHGRFDLVAVHWPSRGHIRKQQDGRRLVLVEVKFGDGAINGAASIRSHITDINRFLGDPANVTALQDEMVGVFNQKRALGLMNCGKDLCAFGDEPPMLLLALANHDPDSTKLRAALDALPPSPHAEIYIATGCFMGYGLCDQAIVPLEEARSRFRACL